MIPDPEPTPGHELRFRQKLIQQNEPKKKNHYWIWYAAAASVLIAVISIAVSEMNDSNIRAEKISLQDLSPRVAETQVFLSGKVLDKTSEADLNDPAIAHQVVRLRQLEAEYLKLDSLLQSTQANERVVKAMITNYKLRLDVLEYILTELQVKKQNPISSNQKS